MSSPEAEEEEEEAFGETWVWNLSFLWREKWCANVDKSEQVWILYRVTPEFGSFPGKQIVGFDDGSQMGGWIATVPSIFWKFNTE